MCSVPLGLATTRWCGELVMIRPECAKSTLSGSLHMPLHSLLKPCLTWDDLLEEEVGSRLSFCKK